MEKTLAALEAYAKDFYSNTTFNGSNVVCSPLGSWLLLASVAAHLDFDENSGLKQRIEGTLHLSVEEAGNAVNEILTNYPALNYVSHAWSAPSLEGFPAIQQWVADNTLIPYENALPSQKELDEWASSNTNGLIKEFPMQVNGTVMLIIANIIYSKLSWVTKFIPVSAPESMSAWGVKNVLSADASYNVTFRKDENNNVFAIYDVKASGRNKESVRLVTCLTNDLEPVQLMGLVHSLDSLVEVRLDDESLLELDNDMFYLKEEKRGVSPFVLYATVPAWEAQSKHDLLGDNGLGYKELVDAFNQGAVRSMSAEAKQVAVAKFDKDGFEAAALTALVMARCAMPTMQTQKVFELNFTKPFAFIAYTGELPTFSGYIFEAKEG